MHRHARKSPLEMILFPFLCAWQKKMHFLHPRSCLSSQKTGKEKCTNIMSLIGSTVSHTWNEHLKRSPNSKIQIMPDFRIQSPPNQKSEIGAMCRDLQELGCHSNVSLWVKRSISSKGNWTRRKRKIILFVWLDWCWTIKDIKTTCLF